MSTLRCVATLILLAALGFVLSPTVASAATTSNDLQIDADYPGGNILVDRIEGNTVHLRQDLRDTAGWWFYWSFRVRGVGERTLTFQFAGQSPIGTRGPAVSVDGGKTWTWLGTDEVRGGSFDYTFDGSQDEVRFCFAMPYQQSHLDRFLAAHKDNRCLKVETLCKTRAGRDVERLHVTDPDTPPKYRILLTARHHACESMADYVLEGFLAETLDDTETGQWFRENVEVLAIPFVDKDGVEQGDQGKNRRPHDHNRDYAGESIYPSVAAIRKLVPKWSQGRLDVAMDLHCPWIRGSYNEFIYMVGSPSPENWQQQVALAKILEATQQGPLKYRAADNLPFGQAWNKNSNYGGLMSCSRWSSQLDGIRVATSFEIPYANARDQTIDAESARAFGHDLARAVREYLKP